MRRKTAKLFEAAARLGAILGSAPSGSRTGFAAYGMHLGTAFQLVDDVLDYSGDLHETGKNLGDDLAEGKPTLPLIHAMRAARRRRPRPCGGRSSRAGGRLSPRCWTRSARPARSTTRARRRKREAAAACSALAAATDSTYKQSLLQLAAFAVERNY